VQGRWSQLPQSDQRAFVHVVLAASFGEQMAGQLDGTADSPDADTRVASSDDDALTPAFDYPGSGCWSSAGCHLGAVSGDGASGQY
jgi:hypothetical protein